MCLIILFLMLSGIVLGGFWAFIVLNPLADQARYRKTNRKIHTIDLFSLTLVTAIMLACSTATVSATGRGNTAAIVVCSVLALFWAGIWYRGVIALSTAKVHSSTRRMVFLVVVLPMTALCGALVIPGLTFTVLLVVFGTPGRSFSTTWLLVFAAQIGVTYLLIQLGHWVSDDDSLKAILPSANSVRLSDDESPGGAKYADETERDINR